MSTHIPIFKPKPYKLTTAEILYHLPDYPQLLQSFVWQRMDTAPDYPKLHAFLNFWDRHLDGAIHSVRVAGRDIVGPPSVRGVDRTFVLH